MKELWIKKTIYRRYLIKDEDMEEAEWVIKNQPDDADEIIGDMFDRNTELEYDEEKAITPIEYSIRVIH
jgi:hypothetical protein